MRCLPAIALASVLVPATAHAVPPLPPPPPPPERSLALTLSPLHLLFPMVEVTGEYRVGPRLGVAAILGAGKFSTTDSADTTLRFTAGELGASARYYALGSFRAGLQVGVELLYLAISLGDNPQMVQATGDGLSLSPFVGYKWTARGGFTIEAQGGLSILAVQAHATDGTSSSSSEQSRVSPMINFNLGWSF